ncbi:FAD-binding protein [Nonomuraea sp. NPDC049309]|uniref:FAD-binding protein n=1 Tax=Nonomuraea sp. NPDC049309 TaxID=3364350 RepID=UPI00372486AB
MTEVETWPYRCSPRSGSRPATGGTRCCAPRSPPCRAPPRCCCPRAPGRWPPRCAARASRNVPLSVRSGGHGLSGRSSNDGGVVVDRSAMNRIEVLDREARLVRIEARLGGRGWRRRRSRTETART